MTVYIEVAFLENFLLDGILLYLALRFSGARRGWRLFLAAGVGGVSAIVYPLLSLPLLGSAAYKLATGILLPIIAAGEKRGKWGGKTPIKVQGLCVVLFFAFSFFVAGGTYAFSSFLPINDGYYLQKLPLSTLVGLTTSCLALLIEVAVRAKRRQSRMLALVDCKIEGEKIKGFVDTGNLAKHNRLPICFASPLLFFRLAEGKRMETTTIKTMTGVREVALIKIEEIRITDGGQTHIIDGAYLASSVALCGREYELLLGSWAIG